MMMRIANGWMNIMIKMNKYSHKKGSAREFCYVLGVIMNIYAEK